MPTKNNENILLIAGKTEAEKYLVQSILAKNGSYLVIDPEGILEGQTSEKLKQEGYHVIFAMLMTRRAFSTTIFVIITIIFSTMKKQVLYLTGSDKIRKRKN